MAEDKSEEPAELEGDGTQAEQAEPEAVANGDPEAAEAGDGSDEPAAEPDAPESLEDALEAAKDAALRAQADAMNVQRRAEQEIEKARKFALERFCGDLLSVVDNLERALESGGNDQGDAALAEGVELTRKGFMDVLAKYGVEAGRSCGGALRSRDRSGDEHGRTARCRAQFSGGRDAEGLPAQWSTAAPGNGDGIQGA